MGEVNVYKPGDGCSIGRDDAGLAVGNHDDEHMGVVDIVTFVQMSDRYCSG